MARKGFQSMCRKSIIIAAIGMALMVCLVAHSMLTVQPFHYKRKITDIYQSIKRNLLPRNIGLESYVRDVSMKRNFTQEDLLKRFNVSSNGSDIIVFLRIQKTGSSSLSRHLSDHVDLRPACNCSEDIDQCVCLQRWRSTVLLKTTNFDGTCGIHAGYAQLLPCVEKTMNKRQKRRRNRRHLYITMVRDPFKRYLSEWMHVKLHGQWATSPKDCQHPTATRIWINVTLEQFMQCPSNPALNRQTHMLGFKDLHPGLKSQEQMDKDLLKSAMDNLKHFAYFGITDYQELSQLLFEETFNIHFITRFETRPQRAGNITLDITDEQKDEIVRMNQLDGMFFKYAMDLFRLRILKLIERTTNSTLKEKLKD